MYQSLGFFVISVVCFIVLAMSVSILTPKREGFKESRDKSFVKKVETVLDGKLFGIRKHIQSNKQLLKNHTNILSSIENGMQSFSNFFTRFNEESVQNFETISLILYDHAFLSHNKNKIKDSILKSTSVDYKGAQQTEEDEENEIGYTNIELIGFIFAKEKLGDIVSSGVITNSVISNHLNIIQNEVADYFTLKHNEHLVKEIHDALKNKGSQFFYDRLVLFRNRYLKTIKNKKNARVVVFKNAVAFKEDWFAYFPVYRHYSDIESKLKSKCALFFELLNDLKEDE